MRFDIKSWSWWWEEWIKPVLIAFALALFIRTFIIQPFKIPSSSMEPTLMPGDRIFVNKYVYGAKIPFTNLRLPAISRPKLGDIVVFTSPIEKKKFLVKRYIAGENETVKIAGGSLFVNNGEVKKNPFKEFFYYSRGDFGVEGETLRVVEESFYVLGDNSANSMDSRYWGFVPEDNLVGRAIFIHWPINRIRILRKGD